MYMYLFVYLLVYLRTKAYRTKVANRLRRAKTPPTSAASKAKALNRGP